MLRAFGIILLLVISAIVHASSPEHSIEALRKAVRRNHNLTENRTSGEAVEIVEEVEALLEELDAATDSHTETDCKCWAAQGQCEQNPGFMLSHCESSCARAMACALLLATAAWGRGEPASFALSAGESVGIEEHGGWDHPDAAHMLQQRLTLMKNVADARLQDCSKGAAATLAELVDVKRHRDELDADLRSTKESLETCETHSRMRKQRLDEIEMKLDLHQTSRSETVRHLEAEVRRYEKAEAELDRKFHMAETRIQALEGQVQQLHALLQAEKAQSAAVKKELQDKLRSVEAASEAADANCLRLLAQERNTVAETQAAFATYQRDISAEGKCEESEEFRKLMQTSSTDDAPEQSSNRVRDEL